MPPREPPPTEASIGFRIQERAKARALGMARLQGFKFASGSKGGPRWYFVPDEDLTVPLPGEVAQ